MGENKSGQSIREVQVSKPLWAGLQQMADALQVDRDTLLNQALLMFARFNGYAVARGVAALPQAAAPRPAAETPAPRPPTEDAARRAVAKHVMDTAAEFERLLKRK